MTYGFLYILQSLTNRVPSVSACQRDLRGLRVYVLACHYALVPTSLRTNVRKACQLLIFTCHRTNKRTNVPTFLLQNAKGNF